MQITFTNFPKIVTVSNASPEDWSPTIVSGELDTALIEIKFVFIES